MTTLRENDLINLQQKFTDKIDELKNLKLKLDITRGKPCSDQLDLSVAIENSLNGKFSTEDGTDSRNYGGIDGIKEAKDLFSQVLEVPQKNVLIGGNSSLTLMYQYMSHAFHFGLSGTDSAWSKIASPSFLCPAPGYDRHFAICEALGIKMINVDMNENGPDMDQVEDLVKKDKSICGIWCVPKYSNPTGIIYSDSTVERLANLAKHAQPFFRIFWDNAYALHSFNSEDKLKNIFECALNSNSEDSVVIFGSTSKISFAGSGVAFMASSEKNLASFKNFLSFQTIGPDKVNQLRHIRFFKSLDGIKQHMEKHAKIMQPKFELVTKTLEEELGELDFASWTNPSGGYFISLDTLPGLAKNVVKECDNLGVKLTPAGSTYPYGRDPFDKNIRIAPSFAENQDIVTAIKCLASVIGKLSCEYHLKNLKIAA